VSDAELTVVAGTGLADPARELVFRLLPFVRPIGFDALAPYGAHAVLVASPELLDHAPPAEALAVWAADAEQSAAVAADERVHLVLASDDDAVAAAGAKGMYVPPVPDGRFGARPLLPAVRRRLRRARALPDEAVAIASGDGALSWCGAPCRAELTDTAFAIAAAVVADADRLPRALAWAAPTVTDAESARLAGVRAAAVVIAEDLEAVARDLARDNARATALAWSARREYETRFDLKAVAREFARRVGLVAEPQLRARALLQELGTVDDAPTTARARELLAPFAS
jgi:hypothetical protein